jgi:hypothetical protein
LNSFCFLLSSWQFKWLNIIFEMLKVTITVKRDVVKTTLRILVKRSLRWVSNPVLFILLSLLHSLAHLHFHHIAHPMSW